MIFLWETIFLRRNTFSSRLLFLKLNNKIDKLILNNEDWLYEDRAKIEFSKKENYCFLITKEEKISKTDENKITINEIKFKKNGKFYVILVNINEPMQSCKNVGLENNLKIYQYPKIKLDSFQIILCKKLIFIGETGSGKTTLINCYINFLMGINKYDDFHFIINEKSNNKCKNISQTSDINSYYILPLNENLPPIKVIDSPGFGDAREKMDEGVLNKFKHF